MSPLVSRILVAAVLLPLVLGLVWLGGWWLFGVAWTLAAVGIVLKLFFTGRFKGISTIVYVAMGWIGVVAARPLMQGLSPAELAWIVAGGLTYTAGVPLYLWKGRRYTHAVWHLFVLAGVACHFVAVLSVMAPRAA